VLDAYLSEHPGSRFPSTRTLRSNARTLSAGKRYRYALAVAGFEGLTGEPAGPGVARAASWLEWYHLYTLFLDDIMDEDVRRRTFPSAWSTNARLYRGRDASSPGVVFRTRRTRYGASQAILDALRIRSLAERAIEGAEGLDAAVRERLLEELTEVDLVLSDGQGLDIDFETSRTVTEADYEAMSERKTGRLYVGAAATAATLAGAPDPDRIALETFARHFSIAFQDRDDLLGSGVVASRIGGSATGDIAQGKRTRLYAIAVERLPPRDRAAFLRAYGRGPRSTPRDVALVRRFFREHALDAMNARIESNLRAALGALGRIRFRDDRAEDLLTRLADAQRSRLR
jgi:geranylgeranyl pyrophosphate synthase